MKAIILAAGRGQRLGDLTQDKPKCLLEISGKTILDWQLETLRACGIEDIAVVKGYRGDLISHGIAREYWNFEYDVSNMVASLFCAEPELNGDVLISYADILFERRVVRSLLEEAHKTILTAVDVGWNRYYQRRFGSPLAEAESLVKDGEGRLLSIGADEPNPVEVQGRFVGLLRLSQGGTLAFKELFHKVRAEFWERPWIRGRSLKMAYMTDFLQALIDDNTPVFCAPVQNGWLEFDSVADYESVLQWQRQGILDDLFSFAR